jgi:CheY-like chemotaxis protein
MARDHGPNSLSQSSRYKPGMPERRSVLIVEDDPDMREMERVMLEFVGFTVSVVPNGRDALAALERMRPAVILLDLMMPVMDGLTFLAERHSRGLQVDIPVVCVSAGGPEMLKHALQLGASECLQKPLEFQSLCDRLEHYCSV